MSCRQLPALTLAALLIVCGAAAQDVMLLEQPDYPVPAIMVAPDGDAGPVPAVLLLHGRGSHKDEVGNLYRRLAAALARRQIASLRIDFAGSGDSPVDYRHYTPGSAVRDAQTALDHLRRHPLVDARHIAVLGFSEGGLIAQLLVADQPGIAALATWSTVAADGADTFADFYARYYDQALRRGYASVPFGWLPEPLSFDLGWFEEMREQRSLSAMATFPAPILAVAGLADQTVPPAQSLALVRQSANPQSRAVLLAGADHIFNVLAEDGADADPDASHAQLVTITADWLQRQLRPPTPRCPAPSRSLAGAGWAAR